MGGTEGGTDGRGKLCIKINVDPRNEFAKSALYYLVLRPFYWVSRIHDGSIAAVSRFQIVAVRDDNYV